MSRAAAHQLLREIAMTAHSVEGLKAERTCYIEGIPHDWGACEHGGCFFVAAYAIRVALENKASKIVVRRGPHHKHQFDVVDLLRAIKRQQGGRLARPRTRTTKGIHPYLATASHRVMGNWTDQTRLTVPVGLSLSGLNTGRKD